jgi:hypothetical protein
MRGIFHRLRRVRVCQQTFRPGLGRRMTRQKRMIVAKGGQLFQGGNRRQSVIAVSFQKCNAPIVGLPLFLPGEPGIEETLWQASSNKAGPDGNG